MSEKLNFVERVGKGEKLAALCREFGVSRQTGHKWVKRFKERGYDGLEEESRRPKSVPLATAEELVVATLQAREEHPRWGPFKLHMLRKVSRCPVLTPPRIRDCGAVHSSTFVALAVS